MSSYRDDTQETAVATSFSWAGLSSIAEETAVAAGILLFGLSVLHADAATASDLVADSIATVVAEQAAASDALIDLRRSLEQVRESASLSERHSHATLAMHSESAGAVDLAGGVILAVTNEQAAASDAVIARRLSSVMVEEAARATDFTGQFGKALVIESCAASDAAPGRKLASTLVSESAATSDWTAGSGQASAVAADQARAFDFTSNRLLAADIVSEQAEAEGLAIVPGDGGQAWTACADGWAMSRYAPYTFEGISVIDGVLYGIAADGVYALNGRSQDVTGSISTGKIDLSGGPLVHPLQAFTEYELDGAVELDVSSTQTGTTQTYTYQLPAEPALSLTSGRFKFGRGLRGRHFSFTLRATGRRAHFNSLRIDSAPTNRRV